MHPATVADGEALAETDSEGAPTNNGKKKQLWLGSSVLFLLPFFRQGAVGYNSDLVRAACRNYREKIGWRVETRSSFLPLFRIVAQIYENRPLTHTRPVASGVYDTLHIPSALHILLRHTTCIHVQYVHKKYICPRTYVCALSRHVQVHTVEKCAAASPLPPKNDPPLSFFLLYSVCHTIPKGP